MNILSLDLGTSTGFAYNRGDDFFCGTWKLGTAKEIKQWGAQRLTRTNDPRIRRLCERISDLGADIVVYEDVQFISSTYQGQLWSSLRAAVWLCASASSHIDCVPVGTLKKFATGSGNSNKPAMSQYLRLLHPTMWKPTLDDNAVDAVWLWLWAKQRLSKMKQLL